MPTPTLADGRYRPPVPLEFQFSFSSSLKWAISDFVSEAFPLVRLRLLSVESGRRGLAHPRWTVGFWAGCAADPTELGGGGSVLRARG